MTILTNEVSWSRKRANLLAGCPRRYFYQYYLKWDGWNQDAAAEKRLAYRLSLMTSLPRLAGIAVHETIRRLLSSARNRRPLTDSPEEIAAARTADPNTILSPVADINLSSLISRTLISPGL